MILEDANRVVASKEWYKIHSSCSSKFSLYEYSQTKYSNVLVAISATYKVLLFLYQILSWSIRATQRHNEYMDMVKKELDGCIIGRVFIESRTRRAGQNLLPKVATIAHIEDDYTHVTLNSHHSGHLCLIYTMCIWERNILKEPDWLKKSLNQSAHARKM